jgi:hypothetical protein
MPSPKSYDKMDAAELELEAQRLEEERAAIKEKMRGVQAARDRLAAREKLATLSSAELDLLAQLVRAEGIPSEEFVKGM